MPRSCLLVAVLALASARGGPMFSPGLDLGDPGDWQEIPVNRETYVDHPTFYYYEFPGGGSLTNANGFPHPERGLAAAGHFLVKDAQGRRPWNPGYRHTTTSDFPILVLDYRYDHPTRTISWGALGVAKFFHDVEFTPRNRYSARDWDLFRADDYPRPPPSRILEIDFTYKYLDGNRRVRQATQTYWMMVN